MMLDLLGLIRASGCSTGSKKGGSRTKSELMGLRSWALILSLSLAGCKADEGNKEEAHPDNLLIDNGEPVAFVEGLWESVEGRATDLTGFEQDLGGEHPAFTFYFGKDGVMLSPRAVELDLRLPLLGNYTRTPFTLDFTLGQANFELDTETLGSREIACHGTLTNGVDEEGNPRLIDLDFKLGRVVPQEGRPDQEASYYGFLYDPELRPIPVVANVSEVGGAYSVDLAGPGLRRRLAGTIGNGTVDLKVEAEPLPEQTDDPANPPDPTTSESEPIPCNPIQAVHAQWSQQNNVAFSFLPETCLLGGLGGFGMLQAIGGPVDLDQPLTTTLANPGFDGAMAPWQGPMVDNPDAVVASAEFDTKEIHSGESSVRLTVKIPGSGQTVGIGQLGLSIPGGSVGYFGLWMKARPDRDIEYVFLNHREPPWTNYGSIVEKGRLALEWEERLGLVSVPADDGSVGMMMGVTDTPEGSVWFDDVNLVLFPPRP